VRHIPCHPSAEAGELRASTAYDGRLPVTGACVPTTGRVRSCTNVSHYRARVGRAGHRSAAYSLRLSGATSRSFLGALWPWKR
jgi:hypothetical protein